MWRWTGAERPPFAETPEPGQESVWDYPRPPRLERVERTVRVLAGDALLVETAAAFRVCETASPPTFYLPADSVRRELLVPAPGSSFCEWKGRAVYWRLASASGGSAVAWSYPEPTAEFAELRDALAFYPDRVACFVDGHRVRPQPGGFYGGWITPELVGPFKGEPGTGGW
jgi:uncharacterized protein (DUF427 family)